MKRKIKVWGKIRIYEASAVGIPSYPDAHNSANSFSLIKALSNANLKPRTGFVEEGEDVSHEVNTKEEEKETMNREKENSAEKQETPESSEEKPEEKSEEKPEETSEEKPEEKSEEGSEGTSEEKSEESDEEAEKKSDVSDTIVKAIAKGIKDGIEKLGTERGLVDKQVPVKKSLGELALEKGLFQLK